MKKVAVLTTGGTIASKQNERGKLEAGVYSGEEMAEKLGLPANIQVEIFSVFQKPSSHITFADLNNIRLLIESLREQFDGAVITHGTDTLEESAYYMDLISDTHIPVVFTGSQRSPDDLGSDAYINLRHAVYTAADPQISGVGVTVVFNERIFAARYVKKEHASNIQGFNSFGFGYLGIIDNDELYLYQKPVKHEQYDVSEKEVHVDIVKTYMNAGGHLIRASAAIGADGIVLEGFGRGQVEPNMVEAVQDALDQGIYVVITTASEEGAVYPTYEYTGSTYDLYRRGAILGSDYDSKKARIKLVASLKAGINPAEAFRV
ncbi:asparaginase [Salisediminibacterium halotolerans]|uniref:asparaginase n=1 Tax=Salisediminibacterium halotolerans TaxID=517425 RepID=UPI000EAD6047|nr:asparaginase [Salisediminibacterium halotolerans]RLJ77965.1 L-asparaginase [Actinophytocola xinjiangensis]RPE88697.1 L-asparaginase [Salisediminibacterium halotolerans]TWG36942.1 L-asparaginase [Salisediminibacterium halotolerans]GEL08097.1 L-asparaginase [Salisediminibacterium halotolerans]